MHGNRTLEQYLSDLDLLHERHVELHGATRRLIASGASTSALQEQIRELHAYAALHFGVEERFFDESHYPEASAHRADHAQYLSQLQDLLSMLAADRPRMVAIMDSTASWVHHIWWLAMAITRSI